MIVEQWIRWVPLENLASKYYVEDISDSFHGFKVILVEAHNKEKNKEKKIEIFFKDSIWAYRNTYESFRIETLAFLKENYGTKFYGEWTFFKVINSTYLTWLSVESGTVTNDLNLIHFCIYSTEEVVDIVAGYEPIVKFLSNKS